MKWNVKTYDPVFAGQEKRKLKYAFLPTKMTNGEWVWLEKYVSKLVRELTPITTFGSTVVFKNRWREYSTYSIN